MSENNSIVTVEYRPVPRFPAYRVGDDGSVWSCWKRMGLRGFHGGTYRVLSNEWKPMKLHLSQYGYLCVTLQKRPYLVHRLILESFRGPCPAGYETRHLNDLKTDNRLENLAWGTKHENAKDKRRNNRLLFGESHPNAILRDNLILECRCRYNNGETIVTLAQEYGVSYSCMWHAVAGEGWQHLPGAIKLKGRILTKELVLEFRSRAAAGEDIDAIALAAGINNSTVRYAIRGRRWAELPGAIPSPKKRKRN